MTKVQMIETEYEETFEEVVQGFGEMGYSRKLTAAVLEISEGYFYRMCTSFDLHKHFRPYKEMVKECKAKGWPKGVPNLANRKPRKKRI